MKVLSGVLSEVRSFDLTGGTIRIPSDVTQIDSFAFRDCKYGLKSLVIPSSVKSIGEYAFYECTELESLILPDSIEEIGKDAFGRCTGLKSIIIPKSVKSIGDSAFFNCTGLESLVLPDSVECIGEKAFFGCQNLVFVVLPKSLKTIEAGAFLNTGFTHVYLPKSVFSVGKDVFSYDENYSWCKVKIFLEKGSKLSFTRYPYATRVDHLFGRAIKECDVIPDGVSLLPAHVFEGSNIKTVSFPKTLHGINEYAYADCERLETIVFNEGLKSIGACAFASRKTKGKIEELVFPSTLKKIGKNAFAGHAIKRISFAEGIETIASGAFADAAIDAVDLPKSVKDIAQDAFDKETIVLIDGVPIDVLRAKEEFSNEEKELQSNVQKTEKVVKRTLNTIETLNKENNANKERILCLGEIIRTNESKIKAFKEKKDELLSEMALEKTKKDDIEHSLSVASEKLYEELNRCLDERKSTSVFNFSKIIKINKSISDLKAQIKSNDEKLRECHQNYDMLESNTQKDIVSIDNALTALDKESDQAQNEMSSLEKNIEKAQMEIDRLEEKNRQAENRLSVQKDELRDVVSLHEDRLKEIEAEIRTRPIRKEKRILISDVIEPYFALNIIPDLPSDELSSIDEKLLNLSFIEMLSYLNDKIRRDTINTQIKYKAKEIDRVKELNRMLGLNEDDGLDSLVLPKTSRHSGETWLPSRFVTLNNHYEQISNWKKIVKRKEFKKKKSNDDVCAVFFNSANIISVTNKQIQLYCSPYCVALVDKRNVIKVYYYNMMDLSAEYGEEEFEGVAPKEGEIVNQHYKHLNADGSPSRRYKDNPIIYTVRHSSIIFKLKRPKEKAVIFNVEVSCQSDAEEIISLFNEFKSALNSGLNAGVYEAIQSGKELEDILRIISNNIENEKQRVEEEKKQIAELKKKQKMERLAAERKEKEERESLIRRQKELNEERKLKEKKRQDNKSLFADQLESTAPVKKENEPELSVDETVPFEVDGSPSISNNVFKVKLIQKDSVDGTNAILYFVDLKDNQISNRRTIQIVGEGNVTISGFVLNSGIDYTRMNNCKMCIEISGAKHYILFEMNISFYSDF